MKLYEILDGDRKSKLFSCIYLWINLVNGKKYVGQTQYFYNRMTQYKNVGATPYLQHAINKYGIDNFDIEIIEKIPVEKLDEREQYWMDYYKSYEPDKGYNICQFASTSRGRKHRPESIQKLKDVKHYWVLKGELNPMYGKKHPPEWRENHSNWLKNKWATDENYREFWVNKMSGENNYFYGKRLVGELNGMYGKQHSEETRRKISEANKGQDNVRSMAIQCVETGVIYKSMSQAAKELGTYTSAIKLAVDYPHRTCQGCHFIKI